MNRLALIGALLATPAAAQLSSDPLFPEPDRLAVSVGRDAAVALPGSLRLVGATVGDVSLSSTDPALGEHARDDDALDLRLRVRPAFIWSPRGFFAVYRVAVDADLTWTPLGADAPAGLEFDPVYDDRDATPTPTLNQAYALAAGEHLSLKAGLLRSNFGLGMLANAGEDVEPGSVRSSPFGVGRRADRVLRGQITALPFGLGKDDRGPRPPLALAVAADGVIEDDTADWDEGDRAWQVLGGVFAQGELASGGGGIIYRHQEHHEGGTTEVLIGLLTARFELLRAPLTLWTEVELAGIQGETTLSQSVIDPESVDVLAAGGVLRFGSEWRWLSAVLEGGFASGDDNPVDREAHTFSFDRNYRVGRLLFAHQQRFATALTAHDLADPTFRGEPARGFDSVATGGAVNNALYLNPRLAFAVGRGFTLLAGYLYAVSEEPYADTLRSGLAGGAPVGPRGATDARVLGHELDLGVEYAARLGVLGVRARLEGAWYRPGEVYDTAAGESAEDVWGIWYVGGLEW